MRALCLALAALLVGCTDPVVTKVSMETHQEDGEASCTHPGYCLACGMDFRGKYHCGPAFRPWCPGRQAARLQVTTYHVTRKSGAQEDVTEADVVRRYGSCR